MFTINHNYILELLEKTAKPDSKLVDDIISEANSMNGLSSEKVATLINVTNRDDIEKIFHTAKTIKNYIYGNRIVLFAPLYLSNCCTNDCLYCGFRVNNKEMNRIVLNAEEIKNEVMEILNQGHKRVLILTGEHKNTSLDYLLDSIDTIHSVKNNKGSKITRINVEIEPLSDEEFKILKDVPIGTYTVFQETYHKPTYKKVHLFGKKSDYNWRIEVMHRAIKNGMHDIGIGALFGLYDYRFEVLGLLSHARSLEEEFNCGPHTISVPRVQYAQNAPYTAIKDYLVDDANFKKMVAVLRLAVPYTGMILSTRENVNMRMELLNLGISQISAGSKTNPGGYKQATVNSVENSQFNLNDGRTSGEVISDILNIGYIPSFCTACYRKDRVGEKFMSIVKQGNIKEFCNANAILSLKEYIVDYTDGNLKQKYSTMLENEICKIENEKIKNIVEKYFTEIEQGKRDFYL